MQTKSTSQAGDRTHTAGKWSVVELNGKTFVTAKPFPELEGSISICEVTRLKNRVSANAKLIAASPELLKIVKFLHKYVQAGEQNVYFTALATEDDETTLSDLVKSAMQKMQ